MGTVSGVVDGTVWWSDHHPHDAAKARQTVNYVVSISGGVASAVAADRALQRYGDVSLWFADTLWEDPDLHRFLQDLELHWGRPILKYADGRTPLEVAEEEQVIPNSSIAPCSRELKIKPFRSFLERVEKPVTVLLGLDWREQHRMDAPRKHYGSMLGVYVDFPLMWTPLEVRPYTEVVESWGIAPPRLYALGFPHNNCGGRCVRQGIAEWGRLRRTFPERYQEVRDWELEQRSKGGARSGRSILRDRRRGEDRPMTLASLEQRLRREVIRYVRKTVRLPQDDRSACFCNDWSGEEG